VMGYTPDLVTGVWMGNADNSPMTTGTFSAQGVGPIWREFMTQADQYLKIPPHDFVKPSDIVVLSCAGRQEIFKVNTPTVKAGSCNGPSGHGDTTASPTPRGPVFPTKTESPSPTVTPLGTPTPAPTPQVVVTYYKTREGDTVQSVAYSFRVAARDLAKANGITVDTPLEPGTVLVIPLSDHSPPTTDSPTPVPPGAGTPGA